MAFPDSRVRVTASHSSLLATGSIPVEGSSRKMTGGPPIRAMPALSFRLLPPLHMLMVTYYSHTLAQQNTALFRLVCELCGTKQKKEWLRTVYQPVAADQFIGMRLQQQRPQDIFHTARHILLWYSSEPGIHTQSFSSCHVVQHGIKLRAVTNALLHLQSRDKCPLSNLCLLKAMWHRFILLLI